jgi:hypothetical protein
MSSRLLQSMAAALVLAAAAPAMAQTSQLSTLPVPGATLGFAIAPNGAVWLSVDATAGQAAVPCTTYCYNESMVRISATGGTELLPMPALHFISPPIVGGDNNIWTYVQYNAPVGVYPGPGVHLQDGAVVQCGLVTIRTSDDNYTLYPVAAEMCGQNRSNLVALNDKNLWLIGAENQTPSNLHFTKININGGATRIAISLPALPAAYPSVADDSKSNIWFASSAGKIGRYVTTASTNGPAVGSVTEFSIASGRVIKALKRGADGNVWFIEGSASSSTAQDDSLGFVTPDGAVTEYQLSGNRAVLSQLIVGRDGTIWFLDGIDAEAGTGPVRTGRITRDGAITENPLPDFTTLVRNLGFKDGGRAIAQWALASDKAWFALRPATTLASWDYNHAVIGASSANFFPLKAGSIYSTAQSTSQSFLRFFNTGVNGGSVSLTFRSTNGQTLGQWTSPTIAGNAEVQYSIGTIEAAAGLNSANNPRYVMSLDTSLTGNFQHVLFRPTDGTLTNLSTCDAGVNADPTRLSGVHSSLIGDGYPSSIVVKNTGTTTQLVVLGVFDARNGARLGTYIADNSLYRKFTDPVIGPIPANSIYVVSMKEIETVINLTPSAGMYHYVIKLENSFPGYLQHLVNNTKLGVVTDMTTSCSFGGATGTAAAPTRVGAVFSPAQTTSQSYLRFYNTGATAGTVTVTLGESDTGNNAGLWTSPSIAPGAEQQFFIGTVADGAGATTARPYYTLSLQSTMNGYFQNVIFRPSDGTLTNLSTCGSGVTATAARLSGVHSSRITGFPSSVVVNNSGAAAATYSLGIYDARNGVKLGVYTTSTIAAGGQAAIPVASIEAGIGVTPAADMFHYTIQAEGGFNGFLQHLVDNQQAGVITDMTTACAITPP